MAQSYSVEDTFNPQNSQTGSEITVLITGAAGRIGSYVAENTFQKYRLRLMIQKGQDRTELEQYGEVVVADLLDLERMKEVCTGIDTVLHLAATPDASASWKEILPDNIIGTYNVFVAARSAECRRLIFASSIHAVSGYPADVQVKTTDPVNPGDIYGVSKCFGEALGRYMAEKEGLSTIAIRIGAFQPLEAAREENSIGMMDAFVSHRDLCQLIVKCIDTENIRFAIFHGLSNNRFKRLDISDARELVGYDPVDDLTAEHPALKPLDLNKNVMSHSLVDGQDSGIREEIAEKSTAEAGFAG